MARSWWALVLASVALSPGLGAQQPAPAPPPALPGRVIFAVGPAASPIQVDGVLDEPAWARAVVVPVAYEWSPGENIPAPVKTDCLVTYDQARLYIAFRAQDPRPAEIRAHLMDRDDTDTLIQDDHIGVMIDTFNDERRGFQFRLNPLGVQADAIFSEQDGVEDFSWDMIWDAKGRITAEGYTIEMALPLKQLRFQPGAGAQTWGFEAFRSYPRTVRHRLSSQPRDRNKSCLLCQENKVAGFEGLAQGRNLEFDPTATLGRTDARASASDASLARGDVDEELGLSARWSPTSNLTVNGALNPDFSQVEADVAQLDVNQRFALYYPEKRPFFLEGIDFFTTPIQAVFTRTVADPYGGGKLTGKQGPNAVGSFVTYDRINNLLLPSNQGSAQTTLEDDVMSAVGRYRLDVGSGSTIGALYAGREGTAYHNRQAGLDVFWRISPSDSIRGQYLRTDTAYPEQVVAEHGQPRGAFGGDGSWIEYDRITRNWMGFAFYEAYSPGFRADAGFVPRVDVRTLMGQGQRRWQRGAGSWFNTLDLGLRGWRTTEWDWDLSEQTVAAFVGYTGPYQTQFQFNMPRDVVMYGGVRYEYFRPNLYFTVKPGGNVSLGTTARFGGGVDYDNGQAATNVVQVGPLLEYRPIRALNLGLTHSFDELSVAGGRLYRANLTQLKAVYNLGVRTFVRAILQYTDISRDPALYSYEVEDRSRRLFAQYLFSYKLNPQTVLFVGYSDTSTAGERGTDLTRMNRTFFVKLGYAWVL
ncbi:MAG: hydrolase [Acidobacteria bacterium]|nr:hydrolase [Acidobacteriota bacterium]